MHRVRTVFGHAQGVKVGEEEVHFGRCFGFGRELVHHSHAVDQHFFTSESDIAIWGDEGVGPDR